MTRPTITVDSIARLLAAVEAAEAVVQADHEAGACVTSEWSCSVCEKETAR